MTERDAVSMALALHEPDFEAIKQNCKNEIRRPIPFKKLLSFAAVLVLAVGAFIALQKLPLHTPGIDPGVSTTEPSGTETTQSVPGVDPVTSDAPSDPYTSTTDVTPSTPSQDEPLHYTGNKKITSLYDAIDFQGGSGDTPLAILSFGKYTSGGVLLEKYTDISGTKDVPTLYINGDVCHAPNIPAIPYDDALAAARKKVGALSLAGCYIARLQSADGVLDCPFYCFFFFVGDPADDVTCFVQVPAYDLSDYYGVDFPLIDSVEAIGFELPENNGEGDLFVYSYYDHSFSLAISSEQYRLELASPTPGGMYTALTKLIPTEGALHYNEGDGCYYTDEGVRFLFEGYSQVFILPFPDSAAAFSFSTAYIDESH